MANCTESGSVCYRSYSRRCRHYYDCIGHVNNSNAMGIKEEMKKFAQSLAEARTNIQMGLVVEAQSMEDVQFLREVQDDLGRLRKKIYDYCAE